MVVILKCDHYITDETKYVPEVQAFLCYFFNMTFVLISSFLYEFNFFWAERPPLSLYWLIVSIETMITPVVKRRTFLNESLIGV